MFRGIELKRLVCAFGYAAVTMSVTTQASANEYQRALESLQIAPLDTPAISTLGDGHRSFGYARTRPLFDLTDSDRIDPQYLTDLSFSQQFSGATLHISGNKSPLENGFGGGFSLRRTSLYFNTGQQSELAWSQATLPGVSGVFKSGFQSARSRWSDTSLAHSFGNRLQWRGGQTRIDLAGRVNPSLYHTGLSWRGYSGDYALTRRNGVTIGQGLSLHMSKDRFDLGYDEIRDINNHTLRALRGSFAPAANRRIGFSLESGISPFTGVSDQRFMLSYSGQISKPVKLAANDKKDQPTPPDADTGKPPEGAPDEVVAKQKSYKKHLIIAGSIIGGAVALASSSGNADSEQGGFEGQHDAARAVLNEINPKSVRENREYGGWVLRSGDNTYGYTSPVKGDIDSVSLGNKPGNASATYHTHGGPDPRYDNEHFSPQDKRSDDYFRVDGYLGTPAGAFLFYDHQSRHVSRLGNINN